MSLKVFSNFRMDITTVKTRVITPTIPRAAKFVLSTYPITRRIPSWRGSGNSATNPGRTGFALGSASASSVPASAVSAGEAAGGSSRGTTR